MKFRCTINKLIIVHVLLKVYLLINYFYYVTYDVTIYKTFSQLKDRKKSQNKEFQLSKILLQNFILIIKYFKIQTIATFIKLKAINTLNDRYNCLKILLIKCLEGFQT